MVFLACIQHAIVIFYNSSELTRILCIFLSHTLLSLSRSNIHEDIRSHNYPKEFNLSIFQIYFSFLLRSTRWYCYALRKIGRITMQFVSRERRSFIVRTTIERERERFRWKHTRTQTPVATPSPSTDDCISARMQSGTVHISPFAVPLRDLEARCQMSGRGSTSH